MSCSAMRRSVAIELENSSRAGSVGSRNRPPHAFWAGRRAAFALVRGFPRWTRRTLSALPELACAQSKPVEGDEAGRVRLAIAAGLVEARHARIEERALGAPADDAHAPLVELEPRGAGDGALRLVDRR